LGISRKYIIPLLNKMDQEKITQRKENNRILILKNKDK
jgi:selenocysteine-specific elongation factor